jgi:hypothetical protein
MPAFKFSVPIKSKQSYLCRVCTFQGTPTWEEMAAKIKELFFIPISDVGVYHQYGSDLFLICSDDELQAYFQSTLYDPEFPIHQLFEKQLDSEIGRNHLGVIDVARERSELYNLVTEASHS